MLNKNLYATISVPHHDCLTYMCNLEEVDVSTMIERMIVFYQYHFYNKKESEEQNEQA